MRIDRRDLLRATAVGAAGLVVGAGLSDCGGSSAPPTTTVPARPAVTPATPATWRQLAASLSGRLVRRGDPGYPLGHLLYNPKFDSLSPVAIAYCATPSDVARSLGFARDHGYAVAPRSGGHSYGGYSSGNNRLVIDVTNMRGVTPAAAPGGIAHVGAGARLVDVYNTLGNAGQLVPGGSCPSVGIAGLTLGGGVGVFARRYGLAADNVAAVTVVTADGVTRQCTPGSEADLYWAC
ncbi:MAG TPA: FAD-dependent oxidoreductase, partial [Acidimicrobiales bacterium]